MEIAAIFPILFVAGAIILTTYIGCVVSLFRRPQSFPSGFFLVFTTLILVTFFVRFGPPFGMLAALATIAIGVIALTRRAPAPPEQE